MIVDISAQGHKEAICLIKHVIGFTNYYILAKTFRINFSFNFKNFAVSSCKSDVLGGFMHFAYFYYDSLKVS